MMYNNTIIKSGQLRIKIFEPLSNKNWLEEKVNTWLEDNNIDVVQINMTFSEDKYILTILYRDK